MSGEHVVKHRLPHGRYLILAVDEGYVLEMHGSPVLTQTDTYVDKDPNAIRYTPPSTAVQLNVQAEPVDGLFYTFWAPRDDLSAAIAALAATVAQ